MKNTMHRLCLFLLASWLAGVALAQSLPVAGTPQAAVPGQDDQTERDRIAAERQALQARFAVQEAACYNRFATHDCLIEARAQRRQGLSALRRQEISLNDALRKRRAVEQLRKLESRPASGQEPGKN